MEVGEGSGHGGDGVSGEFDAVVRVGAVSVFNTRSVDKLTMERERYAVGHQGHVGHLVHISYANSFPSFLHDPFSLTFEGGSFVLWL